MSLGKALYIAVSIQILQAEVAYKKDVKTTTFDSILKTVVKIYKENFKDIRFKCNRPLAWTNFLQNPDLSIAPCYLYAVTLSGYGGI